MYWVWIPWCKTDLLYDNYMLFHCLFYKYQYSKTFSIFLPEQAFLLLLSLLPFPNLTHSLISFLWFFLPKMTIFFLDYNLQLSPTYKKIWKKNFTQFFFSKFGIFIRSYHSSEVDMLLQSLLLETTLQEIYT